MKINQLKVGVILSYIGMVASILINFIYTPIMLRYLGQSQYGLYTLVSSVVNYLSLCSLGFGASYLRFYSSIKAKGDEQEEARLNGMYLLLFLLFAVIAFLLGMLLVLNCQSVLGTNLTEAELKIARILMFVLVINLAITFPATVFNSIISAHECYLFQRITSLVAIIINPLLVLPLLIMGYRSIAMVLVTTLISAVSLLVNIWFCFRKLKIRFIFTNLRFALLKEMAAFSFFIFLNTIIDQINWNVDKYLLGRLVGIIGVSVYGVASQINTLYMTCANTVVTVFFPRVNRMVAEKESDEILTRLFTRIGRIQFIILALIVSGFVFFGRYFISIWAGEEYKEAYIIALTLICPVTIPLIQSLGIEIQRAKNKHQFRSIAYFLIAILNIFVSIPLCKHYGATGAAVGTALALLIGNGLIMNLYYHFKIGLNMIYFWKEIIRIVPALIIPIICGLYISINVRFSSVIQFIIYILLYTFSYVVSMWLCGMNDSEKELLRGPVKSIKNKVKGIRK